MTEPKPVIGPTENEPVPPLPTPATPPPPPPQPAAIAVKPIRASRVSRRLTPPGNWEVVVSVVMGALLKGYWG